MAISILPLTEVKAKLNELVEETVTTHERVTITRHGKPAVVLMAVEDLESMEETLYWRHSPLSMRTSSAREEESAGELWDEAAVRRCYGVGSAT